jgi:hypothetical protein
MVFWIQEDEPGWLAQALERMKATGRWGVVLALPPEKERFQFGQRLWALTAIDEEAHPLFCEAVFLVMTPEQSRKRFALKAPATRILLSPEGRVIASDAADLELATGKEFAASFKPFLHGEGNRRLIERAEEIEKGLAPELQDALAKLGSESAEDQLAAKLALVRKVDGLQLVLAHRAETGATEGLRTRARNLLTSWFATQKQGKLPYGTTGPHPYDSCPTCGLMQRNARQSMFLKFLVPGE